MKDNQAFLIELAHAKMPYGKYKGSYLIAFSLDLNLMLPILIALTMLVFFIIYKKENPHFRIFK